MHKILKFCKNKQIYIFALPLYTSHILQPLNIILFQLYKHFHVTYTGCNNFNKLKFLTAITSIQ